MSPRSMLAVPFAAALLVAGLAGCGTDDPPERGTALVLATHANESRIGAEAISALVEIAEGTLTVAVTDDGQPRRVAVADLLTPLSGDSFSREIAVDSVAKQFVADTDAAVASSPESNTLAAISLAARDLAVVDGPKQIVVLSSGLQTTGSLPMQNGLLYAEPMDVVQALTDAGALPDLSGIDVRLATLGSTAGEQAPVDESALTRLEGFWVQVLEAAGAKTVTTLQLTDVTTDPRSGLPAVTPVPITPVVVDPPVDAAACTATFADSTIGFEPNSAQFLDEAAARATVAAAVRQLDGCTGAIQVLGTTSSAGTPSGRAELSQARAEAVALLVSEALGRPIGEFDVRGLGFDTNEGRCIDDRDGAGALIEERARENRKVLLIIDPQ